MVILVIGLVILLIGCLLRSRGRIAEKRLAVPVRNIVSADMGVQVPLKAGAGIKAKYFFSHRYRVAGRVDYVVAGQGDYVPVEYKSARVRQPRDSDVFQVLTYCFLLQEEGHMVNRGRLKYHNGICAIPYGPRERQEVLHVVAEMRQAEKSSLQAIPGKQDHRCRGCAYTTICREENYKKAPIAGITPIPKKIACSLR